MLHLAHMHTLVQTDTHILYTSKFCSVFVKLVNSQVLSLQPKACPSSQRVCLYVDVCVCVDVVLNGCKVGGSLFQDES